MNQKKEKTVKKQKTKLPNATRTLSEKATRTTPFGGETSQVTQYDKNSHSNKTLIWYIEPPNDNSITSMRIQKRIEKSELIRNRFEKRHKLSEEQTDTLIKLTYDYIEQSNEDMFILQKYIIDKQQPDNISRFNIIRTSSAAKDIETKDKIIEHIIIKNHNIDISNMTFSDMKNPIKGSDFTFFTIWKMVFTILLNYPFIFYKGTMDFRNILVDEYLETGVLNFSKTEDTKDTKKDTIQYEIVPDEHLKKLISDCFKTGSKSDWASIFGPLNIEKATFGKNVTKYYNVFFGEHIIPADFQKLVEYEVKKPEKPDKSLLGKTLIELSQIQREIEESYILIKRIQTERTERENAVIASMKRIEEDKKVMEKKRRDRFNGLYIDNKLEEFTINSSMLLSVKEYENNNVLTVKDTKRRMIIIYKLIGAYPLLFKMNYSHVKYGEMNSSDKNDDKNEDKKDKKDKNDDGLNYYYNGIFHFHGLKVTIILTEEEENDIEEFIKNNKIQPNKKLFGMLDDTYRRDMSRFSKEITGEKYTMRGTTDRKKRNNTAQEQIQMNYALTS
jgi:hypothetical protein